MFPLVIDTSALTSIASKSLSSHKAQLPPDCIPAPTRNTRPSRLSSTNNSLHNPYNFGSDPSLTGFSKTTNRNTKRNGRKGRSNSASSSSSSASTSNIPSLLSSKSRLAAINSAYDSTYGAHDGHSTAEEIRAARLRDEMRYKDLERGVGDGVDALPPPYSRGPSRGAKSTSFSDDDGDEGYASPSPPASFRTETGMSIGMGMGSASSSDEESSSSSSSTKGSKRRSLRNFFSRNKSRGYSVMGRE